MKRTQKPVKKCHDCDLNLDDRCGIYDVPHDMWHHRTCPGYQNEAMYRDFLDEQAKHPPDTRRIERRHVAAQRHTEPHYQGARDPAKR